jgi:hypothetical protein
VRRSLVLVPVFVAWSLTCAAQDWFVFDLGETKAQVCTFLQSHPGFEERSVKKCPSIDDNPTVDVLETITADTFRVQRKQDVMGAIDDTSRRLSDYVSPPPSAAQKTHTVRLVFKHDRLIAIWMTFPSEYYPGVYERARKRFHTAQVEQVFPLAAIWQDKVPHENSETPVNRMAVFVKGITRVYLVRYNEMQGSIMTGWIGLDSRTQDEPR